MDERLAPIGEVLRMLRRDTEQVLAKEVQTPFGRYLTATMTLMLEQMAVWLLCGPDNVLETERARLIGILDMGERIERQDLHRDFEDHSGLGRTLSSLIEHRLNSAQGDRNRIIGDIAQVEMAALNAEHKAMRDLTGLDSARMATMEVPVTTETLNRYFAKSASLRGYHATSVWQIPGGYSKDTYMISTVDASGVARDIVLRRDFPFGPTENSAADEYDVLTRLADLGLPVARPIDAVTDKHILGQPFMVVERAPGETASDHFDQDAALARSVCLDLATTLGRLHALDPVALGLSSSDLVDPAAQIRHNLHGWRAFWKRNRRTGSPLAEAAFQWLEANIPADVARLVPVHGDARQHNVMMMNGRLTALLDWEFIHAGDPGEDLEYTKIYVEPYVEWERFMEAYLLAGGVQASDSGSRFYEVFRALRNFICCDVSWGGFMRGQYPVNKLAVQGVVYRRDFLRWVGEALIRVTELAG